ncbi:EamA family transporter [Nocardioides sp. SYSU DS0663]|uniref:EamA family transporter n=1 Tax=Nocardioides sp. SYSU DS0663 TaxID=3416445 RepID=UPI003F4B68D6
MTGFSAESAGGPPTGDSSGAPGGDVSRTTARTTARVGAALALASILCVNLGLAASYGLIESIGPTATAALRLAWGGLLFVVLVRPRSRSFQKNTKLAVVFLGCATAAMTLLFTGAVARIPLGTASALLFVGPLTVAVLTGAKRAGLVWPAIAACGVVVLTEPWRGEADVVGVALALGAGASWAAYIVLTQRVGDVVVGVQSVAASVGVAALVAVVTAGHTLAPVLTWRIALLGLALAVLFPLLAFLLEFLALRRLTTAAFGTIMSIEPAIAAVVGLLLLGQVLHVTQLFGIALVVFAGLGVQRDGARPSVQHM